MDAQGQGFSPFSILQSYAVYARNVENLELHDVRVGFDQADLRPALIGENIGILDLDRFRAEKAPGGSASIQGAGISHVVIDGKEAPTTQARVIDLSVPSGSIFARDPFSVTMDVTNLGADGIAVVPLHLGDETSSRDILLKAGEKAALTFVNLRCAAGDAEVSTGDVVEHLSVLRQAAEKLVTSPYRTFQDVPSEFKEFDKGIYIRADGTYPVMQDSDQYGAVYLSQGLPINGSVVVLMGNPDLRTG